MQLLRLITAGSVDDGKSTLIGRLLYDSQLLLSDQVQSLERASRKKGFSYTDFSLLTDGLKDELEQGITIDIAHRYFTTGNRKYILIDTPGHVQYTRNFVTGASNANIAVLLIDARHGVTEQTRRHALISSLMGIKHFIFCINKMDLVDYSEDIFERIKENIEDFSSKLEVYDIRYIPTSALHGENVVHKSEHMPWYTGWGLLETLENIHISGDRNLIDGRFPVQHVIRANTKDFPDYRAYAGQVASGVFRVGDEVAILPSGEHASIKALYSTKGFIEKVEPPMSVSFVIDKDIDVSRGDVIVKKNNIPGQFKEMDVILCWLGISEASIGGKFTLRTVNQEVKAVLSDIIYLIDVNTFSRKNDIKTLKMNEIGRVKLKTNNIITVDSYRLNKNTGSLILIDGSNNTVAAGMVL